MFSIFCKNMFRKLLYRPTTQILNYISTPKLSYSKQCVKFIHLCSYRTLSSVAQESPPQPVIDNTVVKSVDDMLFMIDRDAKLGRVFGRNVEYAFKIIKSCGLVSSIQSLYLIRCCGSLMHDTLPSARNRFVDEMWNEFKKLAVPMDASHYNALLKVYIENEHAFMPTDFLSTMEKEGITPNRVTYQRLIKKYCEDGDIGGATVILDYMKNKGMAINLGILNSLLRAYEKTGDFEGSKQLRQVMQQSKLEPDIETYLILATSAAIRGDIDLMFSVIQEAENKSIYFMMTDYHELLYQSAIHGHTSNIDALLLKMADIDHNKFEISNVVLDLVNKGHGDVAYKLLSYASKDANFNAGYNLLIKQLIKIGSPVSKVLDYCIKIRDEGLNSFIFQMAAKFALELQNEEYVLQIFHRFQKEGISIRSHYFWPILAIHNANADINAISKTLTAMCDLGVTVDSDTYFDYVFPSLMNRDVDSVIRFIKKTGHSELKAVNTLYYLYCKTCDWKNIRNLVEKFPDGNYSLKLMASHYVPGKNPLLLEVLQSISQNCNFTSYNNSQDLLGMFLLHLQDLNKPINELLANAYNSGCRITQASADQLCLKARRDLSIMNLIHDLQFGKPLPSQRPGHEPRVHVKDMSIEQLENHLFDLRESGASTRTVLRTLLNHYCKNRNLEKLKNCLKELDDQGFAFTPAAYSVMIGAFVACGNLKEACELKARFDDDFPDCKMDALKVLAYATLLVKNDKFEEAGEVIKNDCAQMVIQVSDHGLCNAVIRFLNAAAKSKNVTFVTEMYNLVTSIFSFSKPPAQFLQCLIKVHLHMDNLDSAIQEFKRCVEMYDITPCCQLLFRMCIERNENEKLQQVVDISIMTKNKEYVLHELAFVFIECGQLQQAQKVFQQLGKMTSNRHLLSFCNRLFNFQKVTVLEDLLHVTKDLFHIDRDNMYFHLLRLYAQQNDYEKAVEVWNLLQEENVQPSVQTLRLLADLLENNDQPIPFVVPVEGTNFNVVSEFKPIDSDEECLFPDLTKYLEQQEVNKVTETLQKMRKGHIRLLSIDDMHKIIDLHAANGCLNDISKIVQVMSYIIDKPHLIVRPLLQKYTESGNDKMMMMMFNFLPGFIKQAVGFNYLLHKAFLASGKGEELVSLLESNLHKNTREFSMSGIIELLDSAPHLEDRVVKLIDGYLSEHDFDLPKVALWVHYFIKGEDDKADEIFKQHIILFNNFEKIAIHVMKTVKNDQNIELGRRFIDFINKFKVKDAIKSRAFISVFNILIDKEMFQEAAEIVTTAQDRGVPLSSFNQATLIHLQNSLKQQGQTLPFAIPLDDSSSSSDSD